MSADITVLSPLHINVIERFDYMVEAIESFYGCCQFQGKIVHNLIDDRSPMYREDIPGFCKQHNINLLRQFRDGDHRGYYDVFKALVYSVETEHFIYLEPDHYFYLHYDFITPILALYNKIPGLYQVYLRGPLTYNPFVRVADQLVTYDQNLLHRVPIDAENTGWIGSGRGHESFSFMPSVFNTKIMRQYLDRGFVAGGPAEIENHYAAYWNNRALVGYLNGQAFCYHIGAAGKVGPGGYLKIDDKQYEAAWSVKHL